jgi:hypothetical protein
MEESGLFTPLLLGAGLIFLSSILVKPFLIEPGDVRLLPRGKQKLQYNVTEEVEQPRPETINRRALWNIIAGAFADNVGSSALFPLCLSPLAIEQYLFDFVDANKDPIMSITAY